MEHHLPFVLLYCRVDLPIRSQPLIGRKSHYAKFIRILLCLFSYHRLLVCGHDLARVIDCSFLFILETCHLVVNHTSAVHHTASLSFYRYIHNVKSRDSLINDLGQQIVRYLCFTLHAKFSGKSLFSIFVLIIKCAPSFALTVPHTPSMVRNVLIAAKGIIICYKRVVIVEYVN